MCGSKLCGSTCFCLVIIGGLSHYSNYSLLDYSYMMMRECWEKMPDNRPALEELYMNTSKHIEHIAGYLDMEINPFAEVGRVKSTIKEKEREGRGFGSEVAIQVTPGPVSVQKSANHTNTTD